MHTADQEAPVQDRLTELEQQIGDLATPAGETSIVRAFGPKGEVFYAVQAFRYTAKPLDYFAIRLRKLGHIRYIGSRERPMYVTTAVFSEKYMTRENAVYAIVNQNKKTVTIGPKGALGIADPEDRGMGLGSFALSRIVNWLKTNYSDFRVTKSSLQEIDDTDERAGRDKFLSRCGLSVVYASQRGNGYFYANSVGELREYNDPRKLEQLGIDGLFATFAAMQEWHKELSNEFEALRKQENTLQSQTIPRLRRRARWLGVLAAVLGIGLGAVGTLALMAQA